MVSEVHDARLPFTVRPPVGFPAGAVLQTSQDFHHTLGREPWCGICCPVSVREGNVAAQSGLINGFAKPRDNALVGACLEECASGISRFEEAPPPDPALQQGTLMPLGGPGGRTVDVELQDDAVRLGWGEWRLSGRKWCWLFRKSQ